MANVTIFTIYFRILLNKFIQST